MGKNVKNKHASALEPLILCPPNKELADTPI